jgi:hypothetical protein
MNRKVVIRVPDWNAAKMRELLDVQPGATNVGPNDYMIERIGEPFIDEKGRRVVEITLAKSSDPTYSDPRTMPSPLQNKIKKGRGRDDQGVFAVRPLGPGRRAV